MNLVGNIFLGIIAIIFFYFAAVMIGIMPGLAAGDSEMIKEGGVLGAIIASAILAFVGIMSPMIMAFYQESKRF